MWDLGTKASWFQAVLQKLTYHPKGSAPVSNLAPFFRVECSSDSFCSFSPCHCSPCKTVHMKSWLPTKVTALLAVAESKYHCTLVATSAHHEDAPQPFPLSGVSLSLFAPICGMTQHPLAISCNRGREEWRVFPIFCC